jgi:hypothetical protein
MNKNFPILTWMFTIAVGPLLFILFEIIFKNEKIISSLEGLPVFIVIGMIMSLPTFFITMLVFKLIQRKNSSYNLTKLIHLTISITGLVITLDLISGTLQKPLTISYSIAVIISVFIIQIKLQKKELVKGYKKNNTSKT